MNPKVFISYNWTSEEHKNRVKEWADRLIGDGIEVIIDIYDLKEGYDKYAFMETMVTDKTITHVLVICDKMYAEKADKRRAGVGTESQLISQEVYGKVKQDKFIPLICEYQDSKGCTPVFFNSVIHIDFSSLEKVNENWEQLIRLLYGKPQYVKPKTGKIPAYILEENSTPATEAQAKYNTFKHAFMSGKGSIDLYRTDFIDSCMRYIDSYRIRTPINGNISEKVLADLKQMKAIRDLFCDWILIECPSLDENKVVDILTSDILEKLMELRSIPEELNAYSKEWFGAHIIFTYEVFLYIIASLIKIKSYNVLQKIYKYHYTLPLNEGSSSYHFDTFETFRQHTDILQHIYSTKEIKYNSSTVEFIRRNADRNDIKFIDIIQADLLTLLISITFPNFSWCPDTMYYCPYHERFPLFIKAERIADFKNLCIITGIQNKEDFLKKFNEGYAKSRDYLVYNYRIRNFREILNVDKWGTLP